MYMLRANCYNAICITGAMDKTTRYNTLVKFKDGKYQILVTTNLLARGIDVPATKLVINFDLPTNESGDIDTKTFIHRIGRAGRFGSKAAAVTLLNDDANEADKIRVMAGAYNRRIVGDN